MHSSIRLLFRLTFAFMVMLALCVVRVDVNFSFWSRRRLSSKRSLLFKLLSEKFLLSLNVIIVPSLTLANIRVIFREIHWLHLLHAFHLLFFVFLTLISNHKRVIIEIAGNVFLFQGLFFLLFEVCFRQKLGFLLLALVHDLASVVTEVINMGCVCLDFRFFLVYWRRVDRAEPFLIVCLQVKVIADRFWSWVARCFLV